MWKPGGVSQLHSQVNVGGADARRSALIIYPFPWVPSDKRRSFISAITYEVPQIIIPITQMDTFKLRE